MLYKPEIENYNKRKLDLKEARTGMFSSVGQQHVGHRYNRNFPLLRRCQDKIETLRNSEALVPSKN